MATVRRHTFVEVRFAGEVHRELRPDADGEWVRYDDHEAAVAAERKRCLAWVRWTGSVAPTRVRAVVSATLGIESGAPAPREG